MKNAKFYNGIKTALAGLGLTLVLTGCGSKSHTVNLNTTPTNKATITAPTEAGVNTDKNITKSVKKEEITILAAGNEEKTETVTVAPVAEEVKEEKEEVKEDKKEEVKEEVKEETTATTSAEESVKLKGIKAAYNYALSYVVDEDLAMAMVIAMNSNLATINANEDTITFEGMNIKKQDLAENVENAILVLANYEGFGSENIGKGMSFDDSELIVAYDEVTTARKEALKQFHSKNDEFVKNPTIKGFNEGYLIPRFGEVDGIEYVENGETKVVKLENTQAEVMGRKQAQLFMKVGYNQTNLFKNGNNKKFYEDAELIAEESGFTFLYTEGECDKEIAEAAKELYLDK